MGNLSTSQHARRILWVQYPRVELDCHYCGRSELRSVMTADHLLPLRLGGKTAPGNIVPACSPCNRSKGSQHPSVVGLQMQDRLRAELTDYVLTHRTPPTVTEFADYLRPRVITGRVVLAAVLWRVASQEHWAALHNIIKREPDVAGWALQFGSPKRYREAERIRSAAFINPE